MNHKAEKPSHESCHLPHERKSHHPDIIKKNLMSRLNRIEGQVRGVKGNG